VGLQLEHHMGQLVTGGCRALQQLKGEGAIRGFGAGVNHLVSKACMRVCANHLSVHPACTPACLTECAPSTHICTSEDR
jgi:hypothetical protein